MNPAFIPVGPSVKYVRLRSHICLVSRICSGQGLNMSGDFRLRGYVRSNLDKTDLEASRKLIIERFGVYASSSTYIGHRWTSFENQNIHMA
jgi:hypothetical protein